MTSRPIQYDPKDLLIGAEAIAEFLFGDRKKVRKVFYLAANHRFPHFRLGSRICALRSELTSWIAGQIAKSRDGAQAGLPPNARLPGTGKRRRPHEPYVASSGPGEADVPDDEVEAEIVCSCPKCGGLL